MGNVDRRDFLKAASGVAASVAAAKGVALAGADTPRRRADVRISAAAYTAVADYPIQPKRHADVTLTDNFWKPKVMTNAEVTIPFEVQKLSEMERGFGGNVLEAAILSLATHPNARLEAQVEARIQQLKQAPGRGNSGFEVAATYYNVDSAPTLR